MSSQIFFALLVGRGIFTAVVALRAATRLHNALFERMIRGTMRFFDQTPLGRILNRFSKDLDQVDSLLPEAMMFSIHGILASISIVILIAIVFPWVLLTLLPLGFGFYFSVRYYRRSSRELRRLDGILTSPVYAHLSASLSGISVIRAYRAEQRFESDYVARVDKATSAVIAFEGANRWIGTRLGASLPACLFVCSSYFRCFRSHIWWNRNGYCLVDCDLQSVHPSRLRWTCASIRAPNGGHVPVFRSCYARR